MCKYHKGVDNKFYIFALPRHSATATSITATFTIKNTGAMQVTVINESRTISITGGTTFTDNFATGNTVHIDRVD
jgi:archaellum component FlaG (FlaF/FlaG flagellin family)